MRRDSIQSKTECEPKVSWENSLPPKVSPLRTNPKKNGISDPPVINASRWPLQTGSPSPSARSVFSPRPAIDSSTRPPLLTAVFSPPCRPIGWRQPWRPSLAAEGKRIKANGEKAGERRACILMSASALLLRGSAGEEVGVGGGGDGGGGGGR